MDALTRSVCLPDGGLHQSLRTLRRGSWRGASTRHSRQPLRGGGGVGVGAGFPPPAFAAVQNHRKPWLIPTVVEEQSSKTRTSSSTIGHGGSLHLTPVNGCAGEREEGEVPRNVWGVAATVDSRGGSPCVETAIAITGGGGGGRRRRRSSGSSCTERLLTNLSVANLRPIGRSVEKGEGEPRRIRVARDSHSCRNEETLVLTTTTTTTTSSGYLERLLADPGENSRLARGNVHTRVPVNSLMEVSGQNRGGFEQVLRLVGASVLLGLGFSFATPAWAKSAPSPQPPIASVVGTSLEPDIPVISPPKESSPKLVIAPLGESFWKNFQPSIGSAEQLMKLYLDRNPNNVKALESLLYSRLDKKDTATAIVILERMMQLQPDELEWKHMKSSVHEDRGEFDKARQGFQEILDDRPLSARALQITDYEHMKLSVHEHIGEFDKARQGFQEILDDQPLSARALQGLVLVMDRVGESKEALDLIEATVIKATQEENALDLRNLKLLLAQFHTLRGNLNQALQVYGELVEEDPYDFRPYLCQGLVHSVMGEKAKAEENFLKYRQLCPKGFPNRDYYDDLMIKAEKNSEQMKKSFEKHKKNMETKPQKESSFGRGNHLDPQQKTDS